MPRVDESYRIETTASFNALYDSTHSYFINFQDASTYRYVTTLGAGLYDTNASDEMAISGTSVALKTMVEREDRIYSFHWSGEVMVTDHADYVDIGVCNLRSSNDAQALIVRIMMYSGSMVIGVRLLNYNGTTVYFLTNTAIGSNLTDTLGTASVKYWIEIHMSIKILKRGTTYMIEPLVRIHDIPSGTTWALTLTTDYVSGTSNLYKYMCEGPIRPFMLTRKASGTAVLALCEKVTIQ